MNCPKCNGNRKETPCAYPEDCYYNKDLWTCNAYCQVCGKQVAKAEHVPEDQKWRVNMTAPLNAICDEPGHSTFSDCNFAPKLEWVKESTESPLPQSREG